MKRQRRQYGQGSVYRNHDGSFTAQIHLHNKLVRRRAPSREAAEAALAELNAQKSQGVDLHAGAQTIEAFVNYWYPEVVLQRAIKDRTAKHYMDMCQWYILPAIGQRRVIDVTHGELQLFLNDLRRRPKPLKPLSAQTIHHVHSVLKQLFAKARSMNLRSDNPTDDLEIPAIKRPQKAALTVQQVQALLEVAARYRLGAAYDVMATLGLRLGEVLALRRVDIDFDKALVTVNQQMNYHSGETGDPKSESSRRTLPIPPRLLERLRAQWESVRPEADWIDHGLLFPSDVGTRKSPRNFEREWGGQWKTDKKTGRRTFITGLRQRAGLPETTVLHDLRRFVATTLEDLGVGQRTIGHILGHEEKNVTERYIKRHEQTMRRALEALEQEIWGAAGALRDHATPWANDSHNDSHETTKPQTPVGI